MELYTIREVFEMLESRKVGVTHKYFPNAKYDPAGLQGNLCVES